MQTADNPLWLAQRAMLAIALMIGFYVLALSIIGLLLWIPYEAYVLGGRVSGRLTMACVITAFAVAAALIPRRDHFAPPGPRLFEEEHPKLFALIRDVATATKQPIPEEVYLVSDVNAWVAQRGGVMGFGSRPIMGLGLPLVQSLTVDELKAVIAHEFGHYLGADVKMGPWIYKTRAAIGRAVAALETNIVGTVFVWYGHLFMRLTMAISRHQEFVADAVAARVTAPAVAARTLRRVATTAPVFGLFMREEVMPVLNAGYLPPIAAGFDQYLRSARVSGMIEQIGSAAEAENEASAMDTHPPLGQRVAALEQLPATLNVVSDHRPAAALLSDADALARALLQFSNGERVSQLENIVWTDVPTTVYATRWRSTAQAFAAPLVNFTVDTLPIGTQGFVEAGRALISEGERPPNDRDEAATRAFHILYSAVAAALLEEGWAFETAPGEPIIFTRGEFRLNAYDRVSAAAAGTLKADEWRQECVRLGLLGRSLAPGASALHPCPAPIPDTAI
jgi:heat shock protein HtpX